MPQLKALMTRRGKTWLFRCTAVMLSLMPLMAVEVTCRILDWGRPDALADPFIGFRGTRPLFVRDETTQRYRIAEGRYLCFRPESFLAQKPSNEFRVFCLGGSTVQGRPYAIETAFTTWFELALAAADPTRPADVVNCGGISYASYRLVPILEEVLQYEPDLILVYTGHNEFLEDRSYAHIKQRSRVIERCLRWAGRLRTYNLAWDQWNRRHQQPLRSHQPTQLPVEVQARLDRPGGLELYQRDPAWQAGIEEHFEYNLRRMVALCQQANVPMWLVNPVCNLRDSPPFKSLNRDDLTNSQRAQWNQLREEASSLFRSNVQQAVALLQQAQQIDDQHAGLCYDLGHAYETLGRFTEAKREFVNAKDRDICPLRLTEPLRQRLLNVARDRHCTLIDAQQLFEQESRHGIPGGFLLVDHVHPSINGHQMIANLLLQHVIAARWVQPTDGWQQRRDAQFATHLAGLDDRYYLEGQRRLRGLQLWSQGRVKVKEE